MNPSIPTAPLDDLGLSQAAHWLADHYHRQVDLLAEQRGWNLRLTLLADDEAQGTTLQLVDGRIAAIASHDPPSGHAPDGPADPLPQPSCDVLIRGHHALLRDILLLRQTPSEPYLFGDLIVQGPEPDFLRLDYIVSTLSLRQPATDPQA